MVRGGLCAFEREERRSGGKKGLLKEKKKNSARSTEAGVTCNVER